MTSEVVKSLPNNVVMPQVQVDEVVAIQSDNLITSQPDEAVTSREPGRQRERVPTCSTQLTWLHATYTMRSIASAPRSAFKTFQCSPSRGGSTMAIQQEPAGTCFSIAAVI